MLLCLMAETQQKQDITIFLALRHIKERFDRRVRHHDWSNAASGQPVTSLEKLSIAGRLRRRDLHGYRAMRKIALVATLEEARNEACTRLAILCVGATRGYQGFRQNAVTRPSAI